MPSKPQAEDKTAGTPDEGRMAPGAEGKGRVRRQRRPEVMAVASKALLKLQEQAISVADFLGHQAEVWRIEKEGNCGQIRCRTCLKAAGFAEHPMKGKDNINGCIVEERCG